MSFGDDNKLGFIEAVLVFVMSPFTLLLTRTLILYRYQQYGNIQKVVSGGLVQRSLLEVWPF